MVSQAQGKIAKWKEQALSLTSIIPTHDAVLQETLGNLESLSHQLVVMSKLQNHTLKPKHWKAIFEGQTLCPCYNKCMQPLHIYNNLNTFHLAGMGLLYVPEKKVTVAELMSLEVDQKHITKVRAG